MEGLGTAQPGNGISVDINISSSSTTQTTSTTTTQPQQSTIPDSCKPDWLTIGERFGRAWICPHCYFGNKPATLSCNHCTTIRGNLLDRPQTPYPWVYPDSFPPSDSEPFPVGMLFGDCDTPLSQPECIRDDLPIVVPATPPPIDINGAVGGLNTPPRISPRKRRRPLNRKLATILEEVSSPEADDTHHDAKRLCENPSCKRVIRPDGDDTATLFTRSHGALHFCSRWCAKVSISTKEELYSSPSTKRML